MGTETFNKIVEVEEDITKKINEYYCQLNGNTYFRVDWIDSNNKIVKSEYFNCLTKDLKNFSENTFLSKANSIKNMPISTPKEILDRSRFMAAFKISL